MQKLKAKVKEPKRPRSATRPAEARQPTPLRRFLGWCVHAYTGLGLILAAMIVLLLFRGGPDAFRRAMPLMFVATIVDATDGTFARMVRIKEAVPNFDGRRLDDLIDFQTYTCLPLLLLWRARPDVLPPGCDAVLLLPLFASAYGFCQVEAKTADGYFLGFPSYWNLVAFYVYALRMPGWLPVPLLPLFAILTFVPSRYLYPTQRGRLNLFTNLLGALWTPLVIWVLMRLLQHTGEPDP